MDRNQPLKKDIVKAWNRLVDHTYSMDDITTILDAVKDDAYLPEFEKVSDGVWNDSFINTQPLTEEKKEVYRKKAALLLAQYERKQGIQPSKVASRSIGRFRKIIYPAAAAAVLLCLLIPATIYVLRPNTDALTVKYVEQTTQRGDVQTFVLPDETTVTLNAASRIVYPEHFSDSERQVELYGEALFDVTPDPERPFTVKTETMAIRVVGTVFDVKAYTDDTWSTVSVASGIVEVDFAQGKTLLEQNRQVKIEKATGIFEELPIDAGKYLSWTGGTLFFNRTPIHEVVNMLNRYFPQTDIELAPGEYPHLISGSYDNKRVDVALTSIVYSTGLYYEKTGTKYILYPKK